MSYKNKIQSLEEAVRQIDNKILSINKNKNDGQSELQSLIETKVKFTDEISKLRRLEWEETHERVNIDYDR